MTAKPILAGCEVLPPLETPPRNEPKRPAKRKATSERFQTINAFCDVTLRDLDRASVVVWLLLWRDTKPNGLARTSQADLARRAGVQSRTVERAIVRLDRLKLITIVRRGGLNVGPSIYRVQPLAPRAASDTGDGSTSDI